MFSIQEGISYYLPPGPRLDSSEQWLDWFFALRTQALSIGIWDKIDPYEPDKDDDELVFPELENYEQFRDRLMEEAREANKPAPTTTDIMIAVGVQSTNAEIQLSIYEYRAAKERAIRVLIMETVRRSIYEAAILSHPGSQTLRQHVRSIQNMYVSNLEFFKMRIDEAYRAVLAETQVKGCEPEAWLHRWRQAFTRAEAFGSLYVQGDRGVFDFLAAISVFVEPEWMVGEYLLPSNSDKKPNLHTVSQRFYHHITSPLPPYSKPGSSSTKRTKAKENRSKKSCPCGPRKHPWDPEDCCVLEFAIRGSTDRKIKRPTIKRRKDILDEIWKEKWGELRQTLEQKGWDIPTPEATSNW
ncbi:hypothetical protein BHE90_008690 [Fusarium euwallaceae]|uniref:Uncharacterized protein n=1 Tax=Fusarium euwallaceae TaxID=1147111 RepID=A0A430LM84_9HYPO|nr:hypothetical protein BHE90_008690 [Fusarium euwallaceae]